MSKAIIVLLVFALLLSFAAADHCTISLTCNTDADCGNPANTKYICSTSTQAGVHSCTCSGSSGCQDTYKPNPEECVTSSFCNPDKTQICSGTGSCGQFDPTDTENYGCLYTCSPCATSCVNTMEGATCSTPTPTTSAEPTDETFNPLDPSGAPSLNEAAEGTEPNPSTEQAQSPNAEVTEPNPSTEPEPFIGWITKSESLFSHAVSVIVLVALVVAGYAVIKSRGHKRRK